MLNFVLRVLNQGLELDEALSILGILNCLRDLKSFFKITILVVTFGEVELIVGYLGIILGELLINPGSIGEILAHVVAIGKK
jgi:hypothetical protein